MVSLQTMPHRWQSEELQTLAVGVFSKASGRLMRVIEVSDPRAAYCKAFNECNDWNGDGAMIAEPVTLREPTAAERKAMEVKPKQPRKRKAG